ncbi:hypothetical protein PTKU46_85480 [Paraburkholderia terrae]|nr:hypothetical protein PTKU15_79570 [Paraburkholderia terrae]
MNIFGLQLRKPSFWDLTVTAAGCSLVLLATFRCCLALGYIPDLQTRVVFAVSLAWGSLCGLVGMRPKAGSRHISVIAGGWVVLYMAVLLT